MSKSKCEYGTPKKTKQNFGAVYSLYGPVCEIQKKKTHQILLKMFIFEYIFIIFTHLATLYLKIKITFKKLSKLNLYELEKSGKVTVFSIKLLRPRLQFEA
jgi:hypothetical protein